ncbi:MAG: EAL domain-containing protein [Oscillospiraceae bacterium]|nr:EAL domain-containing protein [Oscillospiraceae bacterium]
MEYQRLFDTFLDTMSEKGAIPYAIPYIIRLCDKLRVRKLMIKRYESRRHEIAGRSEDIMLYDSGKPCGEPKEYRHSAMTVTIANYFAYPGEGEEPWDETETERIDRLVAMLYIFNSRAKMLDMVIRAASYDDDGYYTLKYFLEYLNLKLVEGDIRGKYTFAYINLKHFSMVNQLIGRPMGTFVMKRYINEVTAIAGDTALAARIGGDNFVLMIENGCVNPVMNALSGLNIIYDVNTGEKIQISATAGMYRLTEDSTDNVDSIMDKLTAASHVARTSGKSDNVYFSESISISKERLALIQQLFPTALEKEEYLVYYQPKVSLRDGTLYGAEALCRWYHDGDIIPPLDFIPVLEHSMDICKLDFYMLDHVCRDIRRWLNEGRKVVRVSVNLSRKHMMDMDLLTRIIDIVDRNDVPHQYIEIELTETTTDVEFRDLKRVVSGLQAAGIYTSVDDFGIGYSSLNLIKEIPWDVIKVDRSFLPSDIEDEDSSRRAIMFKYVVAMAHEMGLECIAEGVETEQQVQVLRDNSCELAQGFYFDKPLPVKDFEQKLK